MKPIQILGIEGAVQTDLLKANVEEALRALDLDIDCEEISEVDRLLAFDIISIPALVINGEVVAQKEVPGVPRLASLFRAAFLPENGRLLVDYDGL